MEKPPQTNTVPVLPSRFNLDVGQNGTTVPVFIPRCPYLAGCHGTVANGCMDCSTPWDVQKILGTLQLALTTCSSLFMSSVLSFPALRIFLMILLNTVVENVKRYVNISIFVGRSLNGARAAASVHGF